MNRSTPGLPVHHQLPEFTETHAHTLADLDTALSARGTGVPAETGWPGPWSLGVVSWQGTQAHGPAGEGQRVEVFLFCVCSLPEIRNFNLEKCSQKVQFSLHLLLFKMLLSRV